MTLADYLSQHEIKDHEFAEKVGFGRTSVFRWRKGEMFPDAEALQAIFRVTKGAVTANDFFHPCASAAEPARPAA